MEILIPCAYADDGREGTSRTLTCKRCGRRTITPYASASVHAECRAWPAWHELGHWVTLALAALGIGGGWALLRRVFRLPSRCGCKRRAKSLNSAGGAMAKAIARVCPLPSSQPQTKPPSSGRTRQTPRRTRQPSLEKRLRVAAEQVRAAQQERQNEPSIAG